MVEDEWAARLKRYGIHSIRQIRSAEGGRVCRPWRGSGEVGVLVPRADALGYESAALRTRGRGLPSEVWDGSPALADGSPRLANDPPGLANVPPGLANDPPGLANVPPGLANVPPGLADDPPGLANDPPGLADDPPGLANVP